MNAIRTEKLGMAALFGLAVLIVTLAVAVFFPETFAVVGPKLGGNHLTPLTLVTPFLIGAFIIFAWKKETRLKHTLLDLVVAGLAVYMAVRNLVGDAPAGAVKYALFFFSLYYVSAVLAEKVAGRKVLFSAAVVFLAVVVFYGLVEYALGENPLYHTLTAKTIPPSSGDYYRVGSTLAHPISLAAFLLQMTPFALYWWLGSKQRWRKLVGAVVSLLSGFVLFLSFTRSSILIAAGGIVALITVTLRRNRKDLMLGMLALVAVAWLLTVIWFEDLSQVANRNMSLRQRQLAWGIAVRAVPGKPVFGAGYGQAAAELRRLDERAEFLYQYTGRNVAVDNQYLSSIVEGGFIQLLLLLAVLVLVVCAGFGRLRSDMSAGNPMWPPLTGIVLLMLNAALFDPLSIWSNLTVFWFEVGLVRGISDAGRTGTVACLVPPGEYNGAIETSDADD